MTTDATTATRSTHGATAMTAAVALLRVVGAGMLGATAGIHAYLWDVGYRTIATIGPLFLLDAIAATALTLVTLGVPRRLTPIAAALGALLELGTVGGLILATRHSLFGFIESTRATLYWQAVIVEIAGTLVLTVLAGLTYRQTRGRVATNPWW